MAMTYYKWMKIYVGGLLALLIAVAILSYSESQPKTQTNRRQMGGTPTIKDGKQPLKKGDVMYCTLSRKETILYLTSSNFKINDTGYVKFDADYTRNRKNLQPTKFIISTGTSRFEGEWSLNALNNIKIMNYRTISGSFDASTNSYWNGAMVVECDGNLTGSIENSNGTSIGWSMKKAR